MQIFCLIGASGSGKDTIFSEVLKKNIATPIVTYTTRPIREGETDGKEYHFVTETEYQGFKKSNKIIEERSYNTKHGVWRYFVADDGQIDEKSDNKYIIIDSLEGAVSLVQKYGFRVRVIHITLDDEIRLMRCIEREKKGKKDYVELCRRFFHDAEDFSKEKFKQLPYWISLENNILEEAVENLVQLIEGI
jgi:guanylate kinase